MSLIYKEWLRLGLDIFLMFCFSFVQYLTLQAWWPSGYGEQKLYRLNVIYQSQNSETSERSLKIGFRTVTLVQEPIKDSPGL